MNFAQFCTLYKDVVAWNAVARMGEHTFDTDAIERQSGYVHEEMMETIGGIALNDNVETLDGLADVFVTLAYKYFLVTNGADMKFPEEHYHYTGAEIISRQLFQNTMIESVCTLALFNSGVSNAYTISSDMATLYDLFQTAEKFLDVDMNDITLNVMFSNWTKYLVFDPTFDYDLECRKIEESRKQTNVAWSTYRLVDTVYVVFRNDFGNGKIMKPTSFAAPTFAELLG